MTSPGSLAPHPSEDELELYALGRLPATSTAPIEEHLLLCESCQRKTAEYEELGRAFRDYQAAPVRITPRTARRPVYWAGGLAAAAVLGAALVTGIPGSKQPAQVELTAWRGESGSGSVPAGRKLDLVLSATGLPDSGALQVAVAASDGEILWRGPGTREGDRVRARTDQGLLGGQYWVRILDGDRLLREFSLRVGD